MAAAWLLVASLLGAEAAEPRRKTLSPHFEVFHEARFLPSGFVLQLERIHHRLRMDFSPWMPRRRIRFFLYADRDSYLRGRFDPPEWSNGIASQREQAVATYEQADRKKLLEVAGHELTHLLFEAYWGEAPGRGPPPAWLNEGLAMMEETESARFSEESEWSKHLEFLRRHPEAIWRVEELAALKPELITDKRQAALWYVQAYALSYFLYKGHSRMQFFNLCGKLRDGAPPSRALAEAYGFKGLADLEKAWRRWLASGVR